MSPRPPLGENPAPPPKPFYAKGTKFVLAQYTGAKNPKFFGVTRIWYCGGDGDSARWTPEFGGARQMELDVALAVYKSVDSPMRKLGLVPVE